MKRVISVLTSAALCIALGGCTLFSPVRELIAAPAFSAQNEELRHAFEASFGDQAQYCAPISGAYLSAFVVEDFDGDGADEALVFYLPDAYTQTVHIGVLDYTDGAWQRTAELEGGGSDVYSVETIDLDADGRREVVLCWGSSDNTHVMSVYACVSAPFALRRLSEGAYTEKLLADLDGDGDTEIFTLSLYSEGGSQTAEARVVRKNGLRIIVLDTCALDGKVSGYAGIEPYTMQTGSVLFADAYKGDGQMITEVIRYDADTSALSAPLLDEQTLTNERTWRNRPIRCRDLDGDGMPEIPCQQQTLSGADIRQGEALTEYTMYVTRWCALREDDLVPVQDCLVHEDMRWQYRIPDSMRGQFTLRVDPDADAWSFFRLDGRTGAREEHLFSVVFTTRAQWEENREGIYAQYTLLREEEADVLLVYGLPADPARQASVRDAFTYLGR